MTEVWWLLQPGNVIFVLIVLAFLLLLFRVRGLAAFLLFVALGLALLPTVTGLTDWLGWRLESQIPKPAAPERVDGIIILGGSVDWRVTEEQGQLNLNSAGERMAAGAALARRYPDAHLVLTGLYRETVPRDFTASGGPQSLFSGPEFAGRQITFIGEARSTYEEALLSLQTLNPQPGSTWLLVTSAMHMPRALGTFSTLGWNLTPWPVDYRAPAQARVLTFNMNITERLEAFDSVVREWAALIVYRNSGRIQQ